MLGSLKARVGSLNVNYRYVAEELQYLLADSNAKAIVVHSQFAPTLAEVLPALPNLDVILQVPDASGNELLPGAIWYEDALAAASPERPDVVWSPPDDLYMLYTGGTTGMPKGVMWRNGEAMVECFGGSKTATSIADFVADADGGPRALPSPPFMHGAGHWMSFNTWLGGGTDFVATVPDGLDPVDIWSLVERENVNFLLIVGDAFARPLIDELDPTPYHLTSLTVPLSGGAPLSANLKDELLAHLPTLMIVDGLGSSEAGGQVSHVSVGGGATTGSFEIAPGNVVLSADLDRVLEPATKRSAGSPRRVVSPSATSATPRRPLAPIRSSTASATRCLVTAPACSTAASWSCTGVTRSRSTRAARSLRRRGRIGNQGAPGRVRLRGRRTTERALGQRGGGDRPDPAGYEVDDDTLLVRRRSATSPATSCRSRSSTSTRCPLAERQGRLPVGQAGRRRVGVTSTT